MCPLCNLDLFLDNISCLSLILLVFTFLGRQISGLYAIKNWQQCASTGGQYEMRAKPQAIDATSCETMSGTYQTDDEVGCYFDWCSADHVVNDVVYVTVPGSCKSNQVSLENLFIHI